MFDGSVSHTDAVTDDLQWGDLVSVDLETDKPRACPGSSFLVIWNGGCFHSLPAFEVHPKAPREEWVSPGTHRWKV